MKKLFILASSLIVAMVAGCSKSSDDNNNVTPTPTPTPAASTYFIEGKVDGVMYRADYVCPYTGCDISTGNYDAFLNWITMQRTTSASNQVGWDILIEQVDINTWVVPDTLDASTFFGNENLQLSFYSGPWQSDNNYLVDGISLGDDSFHMIVTSKTGDIVEGTFNGQLRNGSDVTLIKTVTNGKFKVKLVRI